MSGIFGRIVHGGTVEQWCLDLTRTWFSTYLSIVERDEGLVAGVTQRPRSFLVVTSLDKWPEDQLPAVLLVSTGLTESPVMHGEGQYTGRWAIDVTCICSAREEADARAIMHRYIAALELLFLQRPSLDGNADGTVWLGATYVTLPYEDTRTLASAQAQFAVQVDNAMSARGGPITPDAPLEPDTDPWADWPVVETTDIEVEQTT
jgi:hypothetical protein